MNTLAIIFLVLLGFSIYNLGAGLLNYYEIRRLRDIRYSGETQHSFGVARHELMMLAGNREISSESITFLFFYTLNTTIMRHPDRYKDISGLMKKSLFDESHNTNSRQISELLERERRNWSLGVNEMVIKNIQAMNKLMISKSSALRTIFVIAEVALPIVKRKIQREVGIFASVSSLIANYSPIMRVFVETKNEFRHLCRRT